MGKNGLLDAPYQEAVMHRPLASRRFLACFLSTVFCLLSLYSCSFPRIIVLDDPLSPEEHLNLGVAYERSEEFDNALKEYEKASRKLPIAYLYMGNLYFLRNEYEKAEHAYRKMIAKDPRNADAHNNLAWLYYTLRVNLREAEDLAIRAIELNPAKKDIYEDTVLKIRAATGVD